MKIDVGNVIELENEQAYLISNNFIHDGQEYVALVAVSEPVHTRFAEINEIDEEQYITIVEDAKLLELFKQYIVNDFFSNIEQDEEDE